MKNLDGPHARYIVAYSEELLLSCVEASELSFANKRQRVSALKKHAQTVGATGADLRDEAYKLVATWNEETENEKATVATPVPTSARAGEPKVQKARRSKREVISSEQAGLPGQR